MLSVRRIAPAALLLTAALAGCGDGDADTSPASLRGQLASASELRGFKSERKFDWDNAIDFVGQGLVAMPQSTPPSEAVAAFENAGFQAGAGEGFVAAEGPPFEGPHAAVAVVMLGSDEKARDALEYVRREALKQPCFAVCSVSARDFAVSGIPGAKGVHLTPLKDPPPEAPPPFEAYTVAFTTGPRLYVVNMDGAPGQAKKSEAVGTAEALYRPNAR